MRRLLKEANGNPDRAVILCLKKLVDMKIISEDDLKSLTKLFEIGFRAGNGKTPAADAYLRCRQIADEILASGRSSSPALALALAETNTYVAVDDNGGTPTVVYKKSQQSWESRLTAPGATRFPASDATRHGESKTLFVARAMATSDRLLPAGELR